MQTFTFIVSALSLVSVLVFLIVKATLAFQAFSARIGRAEKVIEQVEEAFAPPSAEEAGAAGFIAGGVLAGLAGIAFGAFLEHSSRKSSGPEWGTPLFRDEDGEERPLATRNADELDELRAELATLRFSANNGREASQRADSKLQHRLDQLQEAVEKLNKRMG